MTKISVVFSSELISAFFFCQLYISFFPPVFFSPLFCTEKLLKSCQQGLLFQVFSSPFPKSPPKKMPFFE